MVISRLFQVIGSVKAIYLYVSRVAMLKHRYDILLALVALPLLFWGGRGLDVPILDEPTPPSTLRAVDTLMSKMSVEDRIAQLFVTKHWVGDDRIGGYMLEGLSFTDSTKPVMNDLGLPFFIGFDLRNGDQSAKFPYELLGRFKDSSLIASYSEVFASHLSSQNVNFVLGPNVDLIGYDSDLDWNRSFSDQPEYALEIGQAVVESFQDFGINCVISSFPGVGSSQYSIQGEPPMIFSKEKRLKRADWIPFKALVNAGIENVLIGNVKVPAIDSGTNWIASNSPRVHAELKNTLGFEGLIWADLSEGYGTMAVDHFLAGSDLMIVDSDISKYINEIKSATEQGLIIQEDIDNRCRRVLEAKLQHNAISIEDELESSELALEAQLVSASTVLLRNDSAIVPIRNLDRHTIGLVKIGGFNEELTWLLHRYAPGHSHHFSFENLENSYSEFAKSKSSLSRLIVIAEPQEDLPRKRFGLSMHMQRVIERMAQNQSVIFIWKGNPKALIHVSNIPELQAIMVSSMDSKLSDDLAIQSVFGGREISGQLKRKVGGEYDRSFGLTTQKIRLAYGFPEEVGIKSEYLNPIDSIVLEAILQKATPGAQVWFAKDGVVVYNKAIGFHTYEEEDTVRLDDLYDLASITKIAGSVAGLMSLTQDSLFNLDYNLCDYLAEWVDTTEYRNMGLREILAHQAGLPAFIPFYAKTLKKGVPRFDIYSLAQNEVYPYRVARELYINKAQPDKMFRQILNLPIKDKRYKYSDVGYYFMLRIIEKQSGMAMNEYLDQEYYQPLGMTTMTYRPLEKFDKSRITPTEYDRYFRNQLVHGDVHDPGAAMLGGVGGHAGLFSNANDLGKLMQLYLNKGEYGGDRYFDSTIINDFIRCQFCDNDNRRGAGFDKPVFDGPGPTCGCTAREAFGHQGFTGTTTWADPDKNVVYVFLSNRVYPNADNRKLASMNVRTDVQQVFYDAIEKSKLSSKANELN